MSYLGRDVEVVPLDGAQYLVTACDSCGGIGSKEQDVVKVTPYIVGRFTTRVALMEVVAAGAAPRLVTAAVSNEPDPTGKEILAGVSDELRTLNLEDLPVSVSTEKNTLTVQTGLGITVIGICQRDSLRISKTKPGDHLYCLGLPKLGPEVADPADPEMAQCNHIPVLLSVKGVHDIIPVGSKGIRGEAELLAAELNLVFEPEEDLVIDIDKSAGPSTVLIFSCEDEFTPTFPLAPINKIGKIKNK